MNNNMIYVIKSSLSLKGKRLWQVGMVFFFSQLTIAQTSVNSPYSMYGIGNLESRGTSKNISLGGGGIALESEDFINIINPASLTSVESEKMILDFGMKGKYTYSESNTSNQSSSEGNLHHLILGLKMAKNWGTAFGINPYSDVSYTISATKDTEGAADTYMSTQVGSGGVYQVFWSNGIQLSKNLKLGVTSSFLMGNITKTETLDDDNYATTIEKEKSYYVKNFIFDVGALYTFKIQKTQYSFGATYSPQTTLSTNSTETIYANSSTELKSKDIRVNAFTLPENIQAGLSIKLPNAFNFVADYNYQKWNNLNTTGSDYKLQDSHRYSLGIEYAPEKEQYRSFFRRLKYQLGGYTTNSYLNLKGADIAEAGITAGINIPLKKSNSSINIAYQYSHRGVSSMQLMAEQSHAITIGFNLSEKWFSKQKFQ